MLSKLLAARGGTESADDVAATPSGDRIVLRVLLSNLPFVIALAGIDYVPDSVQVLLVGAILFFAPGLAWADHRLGNGFIVLFRVLSASLFLGLGSWLSMAALPGPTSRVGFLLTLGLSMNVGLFLGHRKGWYRAAPFSTRLFRYLTVAALLFFVQSYVGATRLIPPLEDQDSETQGTSYGLIHDLTPTMVTNRTTRHFFAHPLLLHFWIGSSALISNDLDRLHYYHTSSLALSDMWTKPMDEKEWWKVRHRWEMDYNQFQRDPVLLPTRTPNLFLGALVLFPLGYIAFALSGSLIAAVGAGVLYATLPEIYVRSAYGGYTALSNLLTMSIAYFYLSGSGQFPGSAAPVAGAERRNFTVGFLTAWANHKTIIVPCVAVLHTLLRTLPGGPLKSLWTRARHHQRFPAAVLITVGFFAGWATYAAYASSISWWEFYIDHVKNHIVGRLKLSDVNVAEIRRGKWVYLSIIGLWNQFGQHTGWLFLAASVAALVRAAKRIREAEGFFLLWIVLGCIGFSLIDWRQTKHLAYFLPGLSLLVALLWASLTGKAKTAFSVLLGGVLVWNVWSTGHQMHDFYHFVPVPCW